MISPTIRIIATSVVRNEKDRYLESCLHWHQQFFDEIFIYDDRSDDGTAELALDLGCRTVRRPEDKPSFIEHEGHFRAGAWRAFEQAMNPRSGDWIFSFDADEFLVSTIDDVKTTLVKAILVAQQKNCVGIVLPFPEIFKVENEDLFYRTDGYWGKIRGPRLFRYEQGAMWSDKAMGCGSEPSYVVNGPLSDQHQGLHVLHFGYAKDEDKVEKYNRYSSLLDHGHNNSHIESILQTPTLKKWDGPKPQLGDHHGCVE